MSGGKSAKMVTSVKFVELQMVIYGLDCRRRRGDGQAVSKPVLGTVTVGGKSEV